MDFKHLQAFLEVAVAGHFGRAAMVLQITQSALTQRIQALERELGVQLLDRTSSGARLTASGEVLLPYARTLVQIAGLARRDLADSAAGLGGHLRLGYLAHGDMPAQVKINAEFRRRFPQVTVETSSASSQHNLEHVVRGELDAAFAFAPIEPRPGVVAKMVLADAIVVVLPKAHPLAQLDPVPVARLRGATFIKGPSRMNVATQGALEAWLTRHIGAPLKIVGEEPPVQSIEAVASLGDAVAFVSEGLAASIASPNVVFKQLSPTPLMKLVVIYLRDNPAPVLAGLLRTVDEIGEPVHTVFPTDAEFL
ncbi:MAG TPA: LysR substrate-binding domain-containing protein [Gaiellales bacterium]|nr:LysR substrate-binding domain-containing protein [Gaiellales bacterium]